MVETATPAGALTVTLPVSFVPETKMVTGVEGVPTVVMPRLVLSGVTVSEGKAGVGVGLGDGVGVGVGVPPTIPLTATCAEGTLALAMVTLPE